MSILLVGGGPDTVTTSAIFDRFTDELRRRAGGTRPPRVAVALFDREGSWDYFLPAYETLLRDRVECRIIPVPVRTGERPEPAVFADVDGIVVGGGPTPEYLRGLFDSAAAIRAAVADGVPYLGLSAGAMIVPQQALIGGFRLHGVDVCDEECSEGLDELEVRDGLGLVPFAVDVHAAQAGTLSRAVAVVTGGLADRVMAIDENTALVLRHQDLEDLQVLGTGHCWSIRRSGTKATVAVLTAG